jgi:carbamoyltransferase
MNILGISAYYHDSAAAIVVDGDIAAAAQEERFTRQKNDSSFPIQACQYCLNQAGMSIYEIDYVVFYDKPFLKFERLMESYYNYAPRGLESFLRAMPVWLKKKLHSKRIIRNELKKLSLSNKKNSYELLFSEHHLSHAASSYYASPFSSAVIVTMDGIGEWATAAIFTGKESEIKILREMHYPDSIGLLYSSFTYFLGFKVNSGEYKLMGLAPYGNPDSQETLRYIDDIETKMIKINEDGSIQLNLKYFSYTYSLKMIQKKCWQDLFQIEIRQPETTITQQHCNLAFAVQCVVEKIIIRLIKNAKLLTGEENLCLAGGVALNCVANGKINKENLFKNIYIQPASGDAGGAIGAALATYYLKKKPKKKNRMDAMKGTFLGPEYNDQEIKELLQKKSYSDIYFKDYNHLAEYCAQLLVEGKIIGWFQGRMEFGPRALGHRSILANPQSPGMQQRINEIIKFRENFRPFAPSVIDKDCSSYFEIDRISPYMLFVAPISKNIQSIFPDNYSHLNMQDKMNTNRSKLQAVTHVDLSARIHTVDKISNPRFYQLIEAFKLKTGCGVLLNTSFNVRGKPIVCTPYDAICTFEKTQLDILVLNNYLIHKK